MPSPLEYSLPGTLAPMLFAFAIFSLGALNFTRSYMVIVDEIFALLAAFCIFAAALLVDSMLDKQSVSFETRLGYLGWGYTAFCVVIGMITISIPILYLVKANRGKFRWRFSYISFGGAGVSVMAKMLTQTANQLTMILMSVFFAASIASVVMNRGEQVHEAFARLWLKWRRIFGKKIPPRQDRRAN